MHVFPVVSIYTFWVALGPPNAEFGPLNGALAPPPQSQCPKSCRFEWEMARSGE